VIVRAVSCRHAPSAATTYNKVVENRKENRRNRKILILIYNKQNKYFYKAKFKKIANAIHFKK